MDNQEIINNIWVPKTIDDVNIYGKTIKKQLMNYVNEITAVDKPTFDNTVLKYSIIEGFFNCVRGSLEVNAFANKDQSIRNATSDLSAELHDFYFSNVESNINIYTKIKSLMKNESFMRDTSRQEHFMRSLTSQEQFYFDNLLDRFKDQGYDLAENEYTLFHANKKRIIKLEQIISDNLNNYRGKHFVTIEELDGVPSSVIELMEKDINGKYCITTDYPISGPIMELCNVEQTRKKTYEMINCKCPENLQYIREFVKLCIQNSKLLGYKNYAEQQYKHLMVNNVINVTNFLEELRHQVKKKYNNEINMLNRHYPQYFVDGILPCWNVNYLINKYKTEYLKVDEDKLREYFTIDTGINTVLFIWKLFYNLRVDLTLESLWTDNVYKLTIHDNITKKLHGYVYLDLFPRDGKYTHACCISCKTKKYPDDFAISVILCNFRKPTSQKPSLLSFSEFETLLHECGHAIHNIFGCSKMPSNSGYYTLLDAVEMPSQLAERWISDVDILNTIGKHYKTKERLPHDMIVTKLKSKNAFSGIYYMNQIYFSYLSLTYFADNKFIDNDEYSVKLYKSLCNKMSPFDVKIRVETGFGHLVGYYAGYYSYMWSKVFADDIFENISKEGILNSVAGRKFAKEILEKGGSINPNDMIKNYLGREFSNKAFLKQIGISIE